jgi:tetratricopeptide (TPR) repeat protein
VTPTALPPETLAQRALQDFRQGRFADAAEGFRRAEQAHAAARQPAAAAEAANNRSVALLQAGCPEEARQAALGTAEIFDRAGDAARAAQAFGNLAAACEACGDLAAAESGYRESARRLGDLGDTESQAVVLASLSRVQLQRGRPLEALSSLQAGMEVKPRRGLRERLLQRLLRLPGRLLGH